MLTSGLSDRSLADCIVSTLEEIRPRNVSTADKVEAINRLIAQARPTGGAMTSVYDAQILAARSSTHLALSKLAIVVKYGSADDQWEAAINAAAKWSASFRQRTDADKESQKTFDAGVHLGR
ncbi:hypothetical protein RA307_22515 [Xanthobacteraceae bacterium Astr-EGSB]|uniref:hypothetical protein n=1 Tax=Astrobacterium formosum TaxID=3069710 RepID=UPI0027B7002B|nr:hypothetical protein [Xanthobacteraceae bacterium Astr-EGSB]